MTILCMSATIRNASFAGVFFFFFQAEDGIRVIGVTGVQTCALPILVLDRVRAQVRILSRHGIEIMACQNLLSTRLWLCVRRTGYPSDRLRWREVEWRAYDGHRPYDEIGRASCRERV